jgi:hypothetical protein
MMRRLAATASVLTLVVQLGCASRAVDQEQVAAEPDAEAPSDEVVVLRGRVVIAGADPLISVSLLMAGGASVTLAGEFEGELRRLSAAEVEVEGTEAGDSPGRSVAVSAYSIIAVNGETPAVGVLVVRDGEWWLEGEEPQRLEAVSDGLARQVGAKVWVTGVWEGSTLRVQSYGVIREP